MGRGKERRRKARKPNSVVARFMRPTEAREAHNDFRSAGAAMRVVPVIEIMRAAGKLSQSEFDALDYYREQAHKAEDDLAQSSTLAPDRIMGGAGSAWGGKIPAALMATPAILETARLERDLGSLLDIARAVAVDDRSLTQWCIAKHGGRERYGPGGKFVAMVPIAEKRVMDIARLELRMAARRICR